MKNLLKPLFAAGLMLTAASAPMILATPAVAQDARGDVSLTLKAVAVTRIVTKNTHLPATTALGSMDKDYRIEALQAGANILMPNFTPQPYRKLYEIYPDKRCIDEAVGSCVSCMGLMAQSIGRRIDMGRGDSLKAHITQRKA